MSREERVLLAGAFGQANPGDEALLAAFARALPDHVHVAISSDPAGTAATHGIEAVRHDNPLAVVRAIARADAIVVAGGTVFKTLDPRSGRRPLSLLRRTAALATVARVARKPLAFVGVGAQTLRRPAARALTRAIVRAPDLLVLRDEESAAALAAVGAATPLRVGADAAWTLFPDPAPAPPTGPLVVALSHLAGGPGLGAWLAEALRPVVAHGVPVRLDPWQPGHDCALAAEVAKKLENVEITQPPGDLQAARASLVGARSVVCLRFHALIAAASAGAPAVAVAHELKLAGLARRLGQPAVSPEAPPAALTAAFGTAVAAAPDAVRQERARAEDAFRLLRVLLARGRSEEAAHVDGLALRPEEWLG